MTIHKILTDYQSISFIRKKQTRLNRSCSTLPPTLTTTPATTTTTTCRQTTVTIAPRSKWTQQQRTSPLTRMNECEESNRMNNLKKEKEVTKDFLEFQKNIGYTSKILSAQSKSRRLCPFLLPWAKLCVNFIIIPIDQSGK